MKRAMAFALLMAVGVWAWRLPAGAQALADAPASAGAARPGENPGPAAAPAHHTDSSTEVRLGARLRCPVCQGMSIGDSPSPMAQDMMKQVRRMHAQGMAEADIVAYFTDRYGVWVLLDPPKQGFALWAWLLPPAGLVAGLLFVWSRSRAAAAAPAATTPAAPAGRMSNEDRVLLAQARQQEEI